MRLGIPTILVTAALLMFGASDALTSTLVADTGVGDLNATSSGRLGAAGGGAVSLATGGALASEGTFRVTAYGNNPGTSPTLADRLPTGSVLAADTGLITMSPFTVVTPAGFVSPSADVCLSIMKTSLHRDTAGGTSYAAGVTIPEPASLALLGAALLGFTRLLRKKLYRS